MCASLPAWNVSQSGFDSVEMRLTRRKTPRYAAIEALKGDLGWSIFNDRHVKATLIHPCLCSPLSFPLFSPLSFFLYLFFQPRFSLTAYLQLYVRQVSFHNSVKYKRGPSNHFLYLFYVRECKYLHTLLYFLIRKQNFSKSGALVLFKKYVLGLIRFYLQ